MRRSRPHLRLLLWPPRRIYEPTWREEISCRMSAFLTELCGWLSGHRLKPPQRDEILGWSQQCRFCRMYCSLPETSATSSTTPYVTIWTGQ